MIRVGMIGYGYWGPNLARNFLQVPGLHLQRVADLNESRRDAAQLACFGAEVTADATSVTHAPDIDAVAIATPAASHFELALAALQNGKHVLVEKPLAHSVRQCERLIEEAAKRNLVLMVDHTFVYTDAVRWIRDFVAAGRLGQTYYFDSIRSNLGLFQRDVSVLWDLAPHDLSILTSVLGREPRSVTAVGACHAGSRVPNIAHMTLDLENDCLAHFHVNWLSPVKVRRIMIAGSERMVVFDDLDSSEKVKVYDSGVSIQHEDISGQHRMLVQYRTGDMTSPALGNREALRTELEHFRDCVSGNLKPMTDGESGLAVVRILEAAEQSLERDGARVYL